MTENNWFTTNLHERTPENSEEHEFEIFLKLYEFERTTFQDSANKLAKQLTEEYDNLYLAYSGGMDSEFVLKTFLDLGLPIKPVILSTPFNELEYQFALDFCTERNITPEIITLDKKQFLQEMYDRTYAKHWHSMIGGIPLYVADYVNQRNGKLLTGLGDPFTVWSTGGVSYNPTRFGSTLEYNEFDYYLYEYDNSHPGAFFNYNISIMYHMIKDIDHTLCVQEAKSVLYGVKYRPKIHMTQELYTAVDILRLFDVKRMNSIVPEKALLSKLEQYIK